MIKITKILLLILCDLFLSQLQAQQKPRLEYCFGESSHWNGKIYTPKQQLFDLLKNYTHLPTCDKRNKIRLIGGDTIIFDKTDLIIPDSIKGIFMITNIQTARNNYIRKKNRLVKKTIYCIDIVCPNQENIPTYMRIISIYNKKKHNGNRIKVGDNIDMKIFPFFQKDRFSPYEENGTIIHPLPTLSSLSCFLFENIWVVNFPLEYRNYI
jgi:translation initiation factor IF-1